MEEFVKALIAVWDKAEPKVDEDSFELVKSKRGRKEENECGTGELIQDQQGF